MSTIIYESPIFGPVKSRRLGISLGINLMPNDGKICSFDCIYCECGFNKDHRTKSPFPTLQEVASKLEDKLIAMKADNQMPDVLTFAGNGEPTANPQFAEINRRHYSTTATNTVLTQRFRYLAMQLLFTDQRCTKH